MLDVIIDTCDFNNFSALEVKIHEITSTLGNKLFYKLICSPNNARILHLIAQERNSRQNFFPEKAEMIIDPVMTDDLILIMSSENNKLIGIIFADYVSLFIDKYNHNFKKTV